MSNNKQSSVEWYINNLIDILGDEICNKLTIEQTNKIHNLGNKAVAMHKQEIIKSMSFAFIDGAKIGAINYESPFTDWEQYYNETFGGNNERNLSK